MRRLCSVLVVAAAVSAACGTSGGTDPNLDAWTREVRVLTTAQIGGRSFEEIGTLEEREPIGGRGEEQAVAIAKENLRRAAARIDADAVVIIECGRPVRPSDPLDRTPLGEAVVCRGAAIRWTDT